MRNKIILVLSIHIFAFIACSNNSNKADSNENVETETKGEPTFVLPQIPSSITAPEERAAYLVTHYWVHFDFRDTAYIHLPEITEQAIANYIDLFKYTDKNTYQTSIKNTLDKAKTERKMYDYFTEAFNKYLYDGGSPLRDDEAYIVVLQYILDNPATTEADRSRASFRMEKAQKNRIDSIATDFKYTMENGKSATLHGIQSPYTLIVFYYPDCPSCKQHILQMKNSEVINNSLENNLLTVLAFYPDNDLKLWKEYQSNIPTTWISGYDKEQIVESKQLYNIKGSPTLYLVDKDKKVILKDTEIPKVEEFLYNHRPIIAQ